MRRPFSFYALIYAETEQKRSTVLDTSTTLLAKLGPTNFAKFIELTADGISIRQIAKRMPEAFVSHNAVAGVRNKYGPELEAAVAEYLRAAGRAVPPTKYALPVPAALPKPAPEPEPELKSASPQERKPLHYGEVTGLRHLHDSQCRWPLWEDKVPVPPADEQQYCGKRTFGKSSYCEQHEWESRHPENQPWPGLKKKGA
jgi:hypothetical protein